MMINKLLELHVVGAVEETSWTE